MPSILLNVPLLAQRDRADCLPACVQMVLMYQGQSVDEGWLRRVLESTKIGTPGFKVLNLERHGCSVTYAPATDERVLVQSPSAGIPPITLVLTTNLPYWSVQTAHAVVVTGIDDDAVIVNDPAFSANSQRVPRNAFMVAWSDFDYLYALIRPVK